jgi:hypothetical protein
MDSPIMGKILIKPGVEFGGVLHPAGARILEVLKQVVAALDFDVTITSARDGMHSGTGDPHHSGEAFDLRVHGLTPAQIQRLLHDLKTGLYREPRLFYAFLEAPRTPNAHIHLQRRKGKTYSVEDYLASR